MNIRKHLFLVMSLLISSTAFGGQWNGLGEIKHMFIYPTYAVVSQGKTWQGTAGCSNDGAWSFQWSQFDQPTQNRIQSMLLAAYMSKTPIQIAIETDGCGPEGKKKFNGQVHFP